MHQAFSWARFHTPGTLQVFSREQISAAHALRLPFILEYPCVPRNRRVEANTPEP